MMVLEVPYTFLNVEDNLKPEWACLLTDLLDIKAVIGSQSSLIEINHKVRFEDFLRTNENHCLISDELGRRQYPVTYRLSVTES